MNPDKSKQFSSMTEQLNKSLSKALESFAHNTEWSDIPNWLANLESLLRQYPSPYLGDKVLLSKRLNQCMNPILPQKVHEAVIRIHQVIFRNMKRSVDGNINDYIHMFAEDLGVYSLSLLPHFAHTSNFQQRLMILRLLNHYYLDLGKELIPMLSGLMKALLSVYSTTINSQLLQLIELTLSKILNSVGRRYVVGTAWSLVLQYKDCKQSGIKFLARVIEGMEYIKGQQQLEEERGLSDFQQIFQDQHGQSQKNQNSSQKRASNNKILKHLEQQESEYKLNQEDPNSLNLMTPDVFNSGDKASDITPIKSVEKFNQDQKNKPSNSRIEEEAFQESFQFENDSNKHTEKSYKKQDQKQIKVKTKISNQKGRSLFQSQLPFTHTMLIDEQEINLNAVPLMVSPGIQSIREGIDDPSSQQNNYPHIGSLVVSALISCLEQQDSVIRRCALDFMQSHLRIKSQKLGNKQRSVLVQALLRLFQRKDISVAKRVNRWLFGKEDQEGRFNITEKNQFVVDYIIGAFRKILQTVPTTEENCTYPIKILQNFYIEHPHLVTQTLSHISLELLRYIFNFGSPPNTSLINNHNPDNFEDILKVGKRFLENLPSYYEVILQSLGSSFVEAIQQDLQDSAFEAVKYIDFCYKNLMKHDHGYEQMQYITVVLQYLSRGLARIAQNDSHHLHRLFLRDTVALIYNLLQRRRGCIKLLRKQQETTNQKYFIQNGTDQLPAQRVAFLEQLRNREVQQQQKYIQVNAKMEQFFVQLGSIVKSFAQIQEYEKIFEVSAKAIVVLQVHLPPQSCSDLPRWFGTLQGAIKVSNPMVSLAAIQALIKCLMWEQKHPIYSSFKTVLMQQKATRKGTDYQKLALEKLWSLLDFPHMHTRIIDMIVDFSRYFPYEFAETVKRSFNTNSAPDKQASIQRFSHFWRLTAYKYKDLLSKHQQFAELNKAGLFRMLDFLDDQNPLVRHAAKSWLMESMGLLKRVIQPLLMELILGCAEWYETPKGLLLIQKNYDTNLIFSTFRRIRAILSNGSYTFLRFVYQAQISQQLDELRQKVSPISTRLLTVQNPSQINQEQLNAPPKLEPVLPKALELVQKKQLKGQRLSYLDLLLILAVKYIEGHAVESMGVDFYIGNAGVNASAVELIQTLLDYIDNWQLCEKMLDYLLSYLFRVLGQVVLNRQYIMQIQLLNLLRNIFLNSSFRKKAPLQKVRDFFKTVFTNQVLLKALLDGLNTPFAYVRSQFIAFITLTTPLIADFLDPADCTLCVRHILFSYYKIIKTIGGANASMYIQQSKVIEEEDAPATMKRVIQLESRLRGQQKLTKFRDNLQQAGKVNQMLSVLQGVESILNYFYDLDKVDPKQLNFEFSNPYTIFDTFKKILTLGFASNRKKPKLLERKNFLHNFETCQALLKDLEPVYQTILRAWPLSEQFVRIGSQQFSSNGMHSFSFERFSRYNKVVKDLITYVESEKESIWGKIYSIMQPLFCRFPKQIIDIYLKLWIRQCSDLPSDNGTPRIEPQKTELLMKIMETIIVNNFPSNVVIHAFLQSTAMEQLCHYYETKGQGKKGSLLDFDIDKSQAKLLYFLYVYFNYVYLNEKELTYEPLLEIWSLVMKALQPFEQSETPLASIWTLQIINLCAKKYSPKQLLKNQKFKSDLHGLINKRLKNIACIASRQQVFFFNQPLPKVNYQDDNVQKPYHIVLPLPPTIYDIYKKSKSSQNSTDHLALKDYRPGQKLEIQSRYRIYAFKVLKKLGLQIIQNTYLPEKTHWIVKRTCEWMDIILGVIRDKSSGNQIFAQCASEVLHDLLERARILFIRQLKQKVLDIFNEDDFFICNANTLRYWAEIIDWVVSLDKHSQTYLAYLQKVTLHSSYFSSQSTQNKRRIKSFQRICFILYAGCKDRYANRLNVLLAKIVDVIKKPQNIHAALLILILFAVRILILRLSEITLNQLFIDIWPMLLTLLMQTFSRRLVRVHIQNEISKNPNYLLAALKLIEMISINNLNEFANHQWIFIADYFGTSITVSQSSPEIKQILSKRPQLTSLIEVRPNNTSTLPFIFKPALLNHLPSVAISYLPKAEHEKIDYKPKKRLIVIKQSFIRDESELKLNALMMMQYMGYLNEVRTQVDWKEVQDVIVNDFITLDSFIHQIS